MGKVVNMSDYRKPHREVPQRGKSVQPRRAITTEIARQICDLLNKSLAARESVSRLGTVRLREKAVTDSVHFREQADALAEEVGYKIVRNEDGGFLLTPK